MKGNTLEDCIREYIMFHPKGWDYLGKFKAGNKWGFLYRKDDNWFIWKWRDIKIIITEDDTRFYTGALMLLAIRIIREMIDHETKVGCTGDK